MSENTDELDLLKELEVHEGLSNPCGEDDIWTQVIDSNSLVGDAGSIPSWITDETKDNQNEKVDFIGAETDEVLIDDGNQSAFDNISSYDW